MSENNKEKKVEVELPNPVDVLLKPLEILRKVKVGIKVEKENDGSAVELLVLLLCLPLLIPLLLALGVVTYACLPVILLVILLLILN